MAAKLFTPGVYIREIEVSQHSIVPVATSVPVFIGYTEKAAREGASLILKPTRIASFPEYRELFGEGFKSRFELVEARENTTEHGDSYISLNGKKWQVLLKDKQTAYLYNSIRLFFANGGGLCYILAVGTYGNTSELDIKPEELINENVLSLLEKEPEPSLILCPDLIAKGEEAYPAYQQMLMHCQKLKRCFAILDIAHPRSDKANEIHTVIRNFREKIGSQALDYGAAYFPWLQTTITGADEVDEENLDLPSDLLNQILPEQTRNTLKRFQQGNQQKRASLRIDLKAADPAYKVILEQARKILNLLPPSGAIAAVYASVDNNRGVWKAPANVSLNATIAPTISLSAEQQEGLNVDSLEGKSINAIREFANQGTLVWGGRTLDGNSSEWRYVNVRRTVMMVEQSIKLALQAYTFEPNNENTWVRVRKLIGDFLIDLWKRGALAGAVPNDAFNVQAGPGSSMTPEDVLAGILRVHIQLALVRPAEFTTITLEQQQSPAS